MATVLVCARIEAPMPAQSFIRFMVASQVSEVAGRTILQAKSCYNCKKRKSEGVSRMLLCIVDLIDKTTVYRLQSSMNRRI